MSTVTTEAPVETARQRRRRNKDARTSSSEDIGRLSPPLAILAWALTLLFFVPVAWMVLTSFHTEADAATNPPTIFAPLTTSNYHLVVSRDITPYLINSVTASVTSTIFVLA